MLQLLAPRPGAPRPGPPAPRWASAILAALYLTVSGMILYFRFGPYRRVVNRFTADGVELPTWFNPVFTVGIGLVALVLLARGFRFLKRALRP